MKIIDNHYYLRFKLYNNIEPKVRFIAETRLIDNPNQDSQTIIGICAAESKQSKREDHVDRVKRLIKLGHDTPLEALQVCFYISGISKSCGAQLSRYRVGQGHVSKSGRYVDQSDVKFVYNIYEKLDDPAEQYNIDSNTFHQLHSTYINNLKTLSRQDARRILPVSHATSRYWWVNIRALRYLLKERMTKETEWEFRRLACLIYFHCMAQYPACFEDMWTQWSNCMKTNHWST
jgi:flavin-dependent thymidylate synthase